MHPPGSGPTASPGPASVPPAGAELLRWQWQEVQVPCLVAAWILVASLAKIGECRRGGGLRGWAAVAAGGWADPGARSGACSRTDPGR